MKVLVKHQLIVEKYIELLNNHMIDLENGILDDKFSIKDFAKLLSIHPVKLSNTIKKITSKTPCQFYKEALIQTSKKMLLEDRLTVNEIAQNLTFDKSNFSNFFKSAVGKTPLQFKKEFLNFD
jgi:AraC family transcriptional regulator, regulatory protein of adaptative response / methylphosphotriester-DNA alkyltransferase methyltransferase